MTMQREWEALEQPTDEQVTYRLANGLTSHTHEEISAAIAALREAEETYYAVAQQGQDLLLGYERSKRAERGMNYQDDGFLKFQPAWYPAPLLAIYTELGSARLTPAPRRTRTDWHPTKQWNASATSYRTAAKRLQKVIATAS